MHFAHYARAASPHPDNAGGIQAQAQPVVFPESAIWSKPAGQPSAIRHASCYVANWLKHPCTIPHYRYIVNIVTPELALTRLAALGTLSRYAGEGPLDATTKPLSCTVYRPGRGGTQPAGWVGEGLPREFRPLSRFRPSRCTHRSCSSVWRASPPPRPAPIEGRECAFRPSPFKGEGFGGGEHRGAI